MKNATHFQATLVLKNTQIHILKNRDNTSHAYLKPLKMGVGEREKAWKWGKALVAVATETCRNCASEKQSAGETESERVGRVQEGIGGKIEILIIFLNWLKLIRQREENEYISKMKIARQK